MKFINLRCRSEFSMLASTCKIDDLLITAVKHKIPALGLCDTGNTFGSLVFSGSLKKKGVKPIIGCLIKLKTCGVVSELPLFAKNQEGYQNILKLTFYANFADEEDSGTITREQLLQNSAGIILLTGDSRNGIFAKIEDSKTLSDLLTDLNKTFANDLFLEIARLGYKNEKKIEERILAASHNFSLPLVATNEVRFIEKKDYRAYDIVTCIAAARYEVEQDRTRDSIHHYFKSQKEIEEIFSDIPSAIENSLVIAKKCNFLVDSLGYMLPNYPLPEGKSEKEYLEETSKAGLEERLQNLSISTQREEYFKRLDYELDVISKMGFSGYFLIVADFIAWAKNNGIPVGPGRGSGAGSMVAWALKITNLDPIHYQLLFERFLNPDRVSMPDFDIDFCQDRRGEVIEYVKEKYGEDKVGAIITFGKLQAKAVLKDVGRVLQVNYGQIDAICKMIPFSPLEPITLEKAISLDPKLKEQKEGDP